MCVCWLGLVTIFVCCTDNKIGAEGARDIAKALEHNSSLQHLNLRCVCASTMHVQYQCHMISCTLAHI